MIGGTVLHKSWSRGLQITKSCGTLNSGTIPKWSHLWTRAHDLARGGRWILAAVVHGGLGL